jgi:hypothetical protein
MPVKVTLHDWLEVLELDSPISGLLSGQVTLGDARAVAMGARGQWPSASQDYIAVLDQLDVFFDDVAQVIDEQREFVERFNRAVADFGLWVAVPVDRLLTETDVQAMRDVRGELAEEFDGARRAAELLQEEIDLLVDQLEGVVGGFDDGDPFAGEDVEDLVEELQELFDALEGGGCLGS